jgi:formylglycine-generating enzyme required for sulfatase activity
LNDIFTEIANNIISNSKNFVLITQNVRIDDAHPKYFKIIIKSWATNNYSGASRSDTVICRLGTDRMLNIITPESNIGFTTPVQGTVDPQNDTKINIPLDNLSVTVGGNPYYFKNVEDEPIAVQVSDDNITYTVNAEAGKASSSISNKIAVVLVLDCSTSLGSAFTPLKTAANSFVDILKNAAEGQSGTGGGQAGSGTYTANGVSFDMIAVPGGTFSMGSTSGEANEQPVHSVTLSNFSIGKYEVTQQLWLAVMGNWPSTAPSSTYGNGNNYPAYYVSWQDIVGTSSSQAGYTVNGVTYYQNGFCYKLSLLVGSGLKFCLPTEAQWEYAAKGGQQSHNYTYSGSNTIGDVAWYDGNRSGGSHPVGTKAANELGIYDMSGNVWEWCSDWYGSYGSGAQTNPAGASSGTYRVYRGGSWRISASNCRVAARYYYLPGDRYYDFGFRLACSSN